MHLSVFDIIVLLIILLWILLIIHGRRQNPSGLPLPPGPTGLPLLGNVLNFPKMDSWLVAAQWRKEYGEYIYGPYQTNPSLNDHTGDLVYMQILGNRVIFANTYETATDLLDKRSLIYSNRPRFTMMRELCVSIISEVNLS